MSGEPSALATTPEGIKSMNNQKINTPPMPCRLREKDG